MLMPPIIFYNAVVKLFLNDIKMSSYTDQISIQVEHQLNLEAVSVLDKLGLKISEVVKVLLKHIC